MNEHADVCWYVLVRLYPDGHHAWLIHMCGLATYGSSLIQAAQFRSRQAAERQLVELKAAGQFGLVVRRVEARMSDDENGRRDPR